MAEIFPSLLPDDEQPESDPVRTPSPSDQLDDGVCPWCGDEFDNPGAHASQAHPDKWAAHNSAGE